ncbi:carboxypeptidase B-like [Anneissia japonica]|uniref:carboxypeptidase B-like n=1 Tax=Anneissia japonica TaxID=1529436 RepID=UPI00142582FF|nr:carboxypeptidase B-like [Anneissia japonica]
MWMSPWGYTENSRPDDFDDQNNLLADAVAAVVAAYGTNYTHGPIANTMYVASGNSVDWTYGALGITYSYAVELRDKGWYGFSLPPRFIEPTAIETFEGLKVVLNHIL